MVIYNINTFLCYLLVEELYVIFLTFKFDDLNPNI